MDLTQLEMFNAVAETGSITQAAAKVHRVPSNLTTRIRQLEADLGIPVQPGHRIHQPDEIGRAHV